MKNILLPISFSETSKNVLRHANLIAKEYNATISLMHCYSQYDYNRKYNFGAVDYGEGIKQMLMDFYKKNIEVIDQQPLKVLARIGSVSDNINEIGLKYDLLILSRRTGYPSKSKPLFSEKLFFLTTNSPCPVLLLSSKRDAFSFFRAKNIWHIQRKNTEMDLIEHQLLKFKIESNLVVSKSLQQTSFTSVFWQNIVNYTKNKGDSQLKKIFESYSNENIDLLILVNHKTGLFTKFLKDDTFQIITQLDIPILVLQSKAQ